MATSAAMEHATSDEARIRQLIADPLGARVVTAETRPGECS
jgi:hypothetical protein